MSLRYPRTFGEAAERSALVDQAICLIEAFNLGGSGLSAKQVFDSILEEVELIEVIRILLNPRVGEYEKERLRQLLHVAACASSGNIVR